jgi:hypothetical protein
MVCHDDVSSFSSSLSHEFSDGSGIVIKFYFIFALVSVEGEVFNSRVFYPLRRKWSNKLLRLWNSSFFLLFGFLAPTPSLLTAALDEIVKHGIGFEFLTLDLMPGLAAVPMPTLSLKYIHTYKHIVCV